MLRSGDDHRAQRLRRDGSNMTGVRDAERDIPGIGRHDQMHLLAFAAFLDGGS